MLRSWHSDHNFRKRLLMGLACCADTTFAKKETPDDVAGAVGDDCEPAGRNGDSLGKKRPGANWT